MKYIVKRDGRKVRYNRLKIENAMRKAFIAKDGDIDEYGEQKIKSITDFIEDKVNSTEDEFSVEQIQDLVQNGLMNTRRKDVAEEFIIYRNDRTRERQRNSQLMIDVGKKLTASNVENQNANVDERSFGGKMGEARDVLTKEYALSYIISDKVRYNHLNGRIYIHDLSSYASGMHNCFQRNTAFITNYGIKTFENFTDGSQIKVLSIDGKWRDATVRYYGRQKMKHIVLERCGKIKEVNCTANHRWVLADGTVTDKLKVGDHLYPLTDSTNFVVTNDREAEMFSFGFLIGDGSDHYSNDKSRLYSKIRLCENKNQYSNIFESANYKAHNIKNSEDVTYCKPAIMSKQLFLTNKMWNILSLEDKIALFNGYMSADGSTTSNTHFVWTSDERVLEMIYDIAPLAGYHIFDVKEIHNSTNYKENRLLYQVTFTTKYSFNSTWKVIDIKSQRCSDYEAWCVEEPVTHTFTLLDGVVTGNCLTVPFDHLLAKGFNTRQADVRPAASINTAFQLVAVLFQLQSLQQFGGVSASHIDHTMVPYVRLSFYKHYKNGLKYIDRVTPLDLSRDEIMKTSIDNKDIYCNENSYQYAMDLTIKETQQAVEGMYHNLNTLQSRSGRMIAQ